MAQSILRDYPDQGAIAVKCDACGYRHSYDIAVLKEHFMGDVSMPHMLTVIAGDIVCDRLDNSWSRRCGLMYDRPACTPSNHSKDDDRRQG